MSQPSDHDFSALPDSLPVTCCPQDPAVGLGAPAGTNMQLAPSSDCKLWPCGTALQGWAVSSESGCSEKLIDMPASLALSRCYACTYTRHCGCKARDVLCPHSFCWSVLHLNPSCGVAAEVAQQARELALKARGLGKAALADSTTVQDWRTVRSPPGIRTEGAVLASLATLTWRQALLHVQIKVRRAVTHPSATSNR